MALVMTKSEKLERSEIVIKTLLNRMYRITQGEQCDTFPFSDESRMEICGCWWCEIRHEIEQAEKYLEL